MAAPDQPMARTDSPPGKKDGALSRRRLLRNAAAAAAAVSTASCFTSHASTGSNLKARWGMLVDLEKCVGCKSCTVACKAENHTPPGVAYCIVMDKEVGTYPDVRRRFMFKPCMQCSESSCTKVCPTGATFHRDDGIVAIEYDKCIGCRYCIAACPYGARSFDYGHDYHESPTPFEKRPSPEYGENRRRARGKSPIGNVRKCTFCVHRVTKGLAPACAQTCMGRAIHFGNLNDPKGRCVAHGEKLNDLLVQRNSMRLKEETGNEPAVYYLT